MKIPFKGSYTRSDLYKAVYLAFQPTAISTITRGIFLIGFIYVLINYGDYDPLSNTANSYYIAGRNLLISLIFLYVIFRPCLSIIIGAAKLWGTDFMRMERAGEITPKGITFTSTNADPIYWMRYFKARNTKDMYVLVTTDNLITIFPRNFFRNENDWQRFGELVEKKVIERTA